MTERELLEFFGRQAEAIESGDLNRLLEHYREDATVIRIDRIASGRDEIAALFRDYLAMKPAVLGVDSVRAHEDTIVYQARLLLDRRERLTTGALVLREGRIWRQVAFFEPPLDERG